MKTRLNTRIRALIVEHARESLRLPEEEAAEAAALFEFRSAFSDHLALISPPRDMKILRKYNATKEIKMVCVFKERGQFKRRGEDGHYENDIKLESPIEIPAQYVEYPDTMMLKHSRLEPVRSSLEFHAAAFIRAREAREEKKRIVITDIRRLCNSSSTIEEVIEVWPGASVIAERIGAAMPLDDKAKGRLAAAFISTEGGIVEIAGAAETEAEEIDPE